MHVINGYIEATLPPTYTNGRSTSSMRIQKQRADMCGKSYPQSCPLHSQKHFWRNNGLQCVYPRHKPNDRLPKVLIPPIHEGILGVCPPQPLVTLFLPLQAPTIIFFLVFATVSKIWIKLTTKIFPEIPIYYHTEMPSYICAWHLCFKLVHKPGKTQGCTMNWAACSSTFSALSYSHATYPAWTCTPAWSWLQWIGPRHCKTICPCPTKSDWDPVAEWSPQKWSIVYAPNTYFRNLFTSSPDDQTACDLTAPAWQVFIGQKCHFGVFHQHDITSS